METVNTGLDWSGIIVALISIIPAFLTAYMTYKIQKAKNNKRQKAKLINHPVFNRIDSHLRILKTDFKIESNKGKEFLWRDILTNKYLILKEELYRVAEETDNCMNGCKGNKEDCPLMQERQLKCLNDTILRYNSYYLDDSKYTKEEQELIRVALSKFNEWHNPRIEYIEQGIINISNDSIFHYGCLDKAVSIFDIYTYVLAMTLNDAKQSIDELNGSLTRLGYKFKGEVV